MLKYDPCFNLPLMRQIECTGNADKIDLGNFLHKQGFLEPLLAESTAPRIAKIDYGPFIGYTVHVSPDACYLEWESCKSDLPVLDLE